MSGRAQRRLVAIVAADVAGYSRLIGADEEGTLSALRAHRHELIDPLLAEHVGRIANTAGDSLLLEFLSAVNAVRFSVAVQKGMAARNANVPPEQRVVYRIGINVGDVVAEGDDLLGDGVNVAARLEGLANPGGICVSRTVRDQIRDKFDFALEDMGEVEVKNIARPIRAFRVLTEPGTEAPARKRRAARRWPAIVSVVAIVIAAVGAISWWQPWTREAEKGSLERRFDLPTIAVLPFDNMSGDPEQEYFSDGITEDLITDLSRVSGLFVMARSTTFTYKNKSLTAQQVAEELGVDYLLEGSVRKAGTRIRVNAQLVDGRSGLHLWADRYDRELTDVFALQDEVVQKIVSALAVRLTAREEERLGQAAKVNPEAYDVLLRGLQKYRRFTRETNSEAREIFEKAIALDPNFARAYADLALTHAMDVTLGWAETHDASVRRAKEVAEHALNLDDSLPQVYFTLSIIHRLENQHDEAIAAARRAVELEPSYADGYGVMANALNYAGRPQEGRDAIQTAMRLNPLHPFYYVWVLGQSHFLLGSYQEAIEQFENVVRSNPQFPAGHLALAASYGQAGRIEDAEWEAVEVLALLPDFSITKERETAPYKNPADLQRWIEGLGKAGLPE